jgi:hypothetical protein
MNHSKGQEPPSRLQLLWLTRAPWAAHCKDRPCCFLYRPVCHRVLIVLQTHDYVLQVLYALDAKVDSVVSLATGEVQGGGVSPPEVWWESLSHRPPFKYVVSAYQQAHDAVVQTPIYTK